MNIYNKNPVQTALIMLLLFFVISFLLLNIYLEQERQRDLDSWQSKLNIMADANERKIEGYLAEQKNKITALSGNSTIQLFLTEKNLNKNKKDDVFRAQYAHVRNLMRSLASEYGVDGARTQSVNTENEPRINKGLAILDSDGKKLMATKGFLKEDSFYRETIQLALSGQEVRVIDFFRIENGQILFGYVAPVMQIHGIGGNKPVGAVVILFDAKDSIYKQIESIHVDLQTDETVLVKAVGNNILYLSPLKGGYDAFHQQSINAETVASVFAVKNTGEFSIKRDYSGNNVLVLSRIINGTEWVLMQKIDSAEALKESDDHQQFLIITMTLAILLMSAFFVAIWRHSTSRRLLRLTNELESRTALLNAVSDNINEHIFLLNKSDEFVFANMSLANRLKILPSDFQGKTVTSVLGAEVAKIMRGTSCEGDKTNTSKCMLTIPIGHSENTYHVSSVTLENGDYKDNKLFVLHDLTALKTEQEKREKLSKGIIATLVKAVDMHDPYCVDHSVRTREVAMAIASEMGLGDKSCDSLEMASLLANIGKLFVPKEILTKMDRLSDEEDAQLKKNIGYAVDILNKLEFDGPVVDIISQKNEHLDGSGYPAGLSADEILLESRILSVANAFVAMASSRAYRKGREINAVIDILLDQADACYDRKVVAALFHIAENKTDWQKWQNVSEFSI